MEEIEGAQDMTRRAVATSRKLVRDFHGEYFMEGTSPDEPSPENHAFEWLSLVTPKVVYSNPTVEVSTRYSGADQMLVKGLGHAVNRWAEDVDLWKTLTRVWYDVAFGFGVTISGLEPMPGYHGYSQAKPLRPSLRRIPPWRYFIDPRCEDQAEARFQGHAMVRDKDDLLNDPSFNHDVVSELAADADLGKLNEEDRANGKESVKRNEIVMYEVWIPESDGGSPEEGFHGTIYTLGTTRGENQTNKGDAKWIRDPRPYYGPKWGPYKLWGVYIVPGYVMPLSPLAATDAQVREMNQHARQAAEDARLYKRFIGFDPQNRAAGKAAKDARHGDVVAISGLGQGAIQQFELGGASDFQLKYLEYTRARVERVTGLGEAQQGRVAPSGTATGQNIAAQSHADRLSLIQNMFADCTASVLYTAAWYLWSSEFVMMRLGSDAAADLMPRPDDLPEESEAYRVAAEQSVPVDEVREALKWEPQATWFGGNPIEEFEDIQLKIEAYSMQRVDSVTLQARGRDQFQLLVESAPVMATTPWIKWPELLDQVGEPLNMKGLGDVLDEQVLRQAQGVGQVNGAVPGQVGEPTTGGAGTETQVTAAQLGADVGVA